MSIDDKFVPLTLKKDRAIGFKMDINKLYALVLPMQNNNNLKILDFKLKWLELKMNLLPKVQIVQFSAETREKTPINTFSSCMKLLLKFYETEKAKVFSIYCLLFVYWCSDQKIKINIDIDFSKALKELLNEASFTSNMDAVQALKALFPLLSYESKTGVKGMLLKENGQPVKRTTIPQIEVEEYQSIENLLDLKELEESVSRYQKKKKNKLYKELTLNLNKTNKTIVDSISTLLQKVKLTTQYDF